MSFPSLKSDVIRSYSSVLEKDHDELNNDNAALEQSTKSKRHSSFFSTDGASIELDTVGGDSWVDVDSAITQALLTCKNYILFSYNCLLILIGWRRLRSKHDKLPLFKRIYNHVYPFIIFTMILFGCICQVASCFERTKAVAPSKYGDFNVIVCNSNYIKDIFSYILILSCYPIGLYMFRWAEPEHISSLATTVFLSFNGTSISRSRKRPIFVLLGFMVAGVIWYIGSVFINILRLFALGFTDKNSVISIYTNYSTEGENTNIVLKMPEKDYHIFQTVLFISSLFGFMFLDLLYIAIILNYCFQCQLLIFYVQNIIDKVRTKGYNSLLGACKEVFRVFDFLKKLNGWLSLATSLVLFIFVGGVIDAYLNLNKAYKPVNVALGFLNVFQWSTTILFPVIMSARFTKISRSLTRLGIEIAQRPYNYSTIPDIELHFFLSYMSSTNYAAKLGLVPMYPALVSGTIIIVLLFYIAGIVIPQITSINWA